MKIVWTRTHVRSSTVRTMDWIAKDALAEAPGMYVMAIVTRSELSRPTMPASAMVELSKRLTVTPDDADAVMLAMAFD